jgi:hypothetical protein
MAFPVSNVVVATHTFGAWIDRTNELADLMTYQVITANSLPEGAYTEGNAFVNGIFSANVLAITNELRGGVVNASANLTISSNTSFTGTVINISANVAGLNTNTYFDADRFYIVGGNVDITSNTYVNAANVFINTNAATIQGNDVFVTANVEFTQNNVVLNTEFLEHDGTSLTSTANAEFTGSDFDVYANVSILGSVHTILGNVNFDTGTLFVDSVNNRVGFACTTPDATVTVNGTANVAGATRLLNTLTVVGTTVLANTLTVNGAITAANTLSLTGLASFSNTLAVTGATTLGNTLSVTNVATFSNNVVVHGNATVNGVITVATDHVIQVSSNNDIGASVDTPLDILVFTPSTYSTVKILATSRTANDYIVQGNEMILSHNGTDSAVTVYGTVHTPASSNVGVFSTSINSTAVAVKFTQKYANSKVKLVAHFLK